MLSSLLRPARKVRISSAAALAGGCADLKTPRQSMRREAFCRAGMFESVSTAAAAQQAVSERSRDTLASPRTATAMTGIDMPCAAQF
ncbi:hypothetical protein Stsp01_65640 [Streptomyces sp. NBRC 13847]|nr:hypothetical protein Stsp01_65640 [Streptomyces sp. NBRC 13847]